MMEKISNHLKGIYRDILKQPGQGIVFDSGWNSNTIVDHCRMLLAGFMADITESSGVQHMAVGQGQQAWDDGIIPETDPETNELVSAYSPEIDHSELDFTYLDALDNSTAGPTSRLQITATLAPGYPEPPSGMTTYPLREFGLFGQFNGNDYMINSIRHPVIHKGATATLIRTVRLSF